MSRGERPWESASRNPVNPQALFDYYISYWNTAWRELFTLAYVFVCVCVFVMRWFNLLQLHFFLKYPSLHPISFPPPFYSSFLLFSWVKLFSAPVGPGESSFLLLLYSTPSCITLLYWSLGSIVVSACVCMCPSYIHPATKGHFISHLSPRPVSLKSRHTHIFVLKFLQVAPNSSSKPHLHLWICFVFL